MNSAPSIFLRFIKRWQRKKLTVQLFIAERASVNYQIYISLHLMWQIMAIKALRWETCLKRYSHNSLLNAALQIAVKSLWRRIVYRNPWSDIINRNYFNKYLHSQSPRTTLRVFPRLLMRSDIHAHGWAHSLTDVGAQLFSQLDKSDQSSNHNQPLGEIHRCIYMTKQRQVLCLPN